MLILLTAGLIYQIYVEENFTIYQETLRFHVRAAADSEKEQSLKLSVRDEVLAEIKDEANQARSAWELEEQIENQLEQIRQTALKVLRENESEKDVRVFLTQERFPVRRYGGVVFPAGEYHALRIDIGEAKGHNWWCAIYPELCYNAEEPAALSGKGKKDMEEILSGEERQTLYGKKIQFRFKIFEWFSKLK